MFIGEWMGTSCFNDYSRQSSETFLRHKLKRRWSLTIVAVRGNSGQALSVLVFFLGIGSVLFSSALSASLGLAASGAGGGSPQDLEHHVAGVMLSEQRCW